MTSLSLRAIKPIYYLLLALPVAIAGSLLRWNPLLNFGVAALGLVPLAALIGEATEALAEDTGPRIGGLPAIATGNASSR